MEIGRRKWAAATARGMTLIEIMVVVAILGLVSTVIAVGVASAWENAQQKAAALQLHRYAEAVAMYRLQKGRYPTTAEGLPAVAGERLLEGGVRPDPWGGTILYLSPGPDGPRGFLLRSPGPDGIAGNEDDLVRGS